MLLRLQQINNHYFKYLSVFVSTRLRLFFINFCFFCKQTENYDKSDENFGSKKTVTRNFSFSCYHSPLKSIPYFYSSLFTAKPSRTFNNLGVNCLLVI